MANDSPLDLQCASNRSRDVVELSYEVGKQGLTYKFSVEINCIIASIPVSSEEVDWPGPLVQGEAIAQEN